MNGRLLLVTALSHHVLDANIVYAELGDQFQVCHVYFTFSIGNEYFSVFIFSFPIFFEGYS